MFLRVGKGASIKAIDIIGAGPAGLVAAINLAKAGFAVTLHESAPGVGHRFHRDFQGIENWTSENDACELLKRMNVNVNFRFVPYRGGVFFSPTHNDVRSGRVSPFFILSKRGGAEGCLDFGLLLQAESAGAKVVFGARSGNVDHGGIIALGPRAADVIAKGIVFETKNDRRNIC